MVCTNMEDKNLKPQLANINVILWGNWMET